MKRVMISCGMRNRRNVEEYVRECERVVLEHYEYLEEKVSIIDTFFRDFNGNTMQFLGKAILEGISVCDEIVFMDDWERYDGCRCEHFIAAQYDVPCVYLSTKIRRK